MKDDIVRMIVNKNELNKLYEIDVVKGSPGAAWTHRAIVDQDCLVFVEVGSGLERASKPLIVLDEEAVRHLHGQLSAKGFRSIADDLRALNQPPENVHALCIEERADVLREQLEMLWQLVFGLVSAMGGGVKDD